jgi:hypothetical protein
MNAEGRAKGEKDIAADDAPYNTASPTPQLIEVAPVHGISVQGVGAPGGPAHLEAIRLLYQAGEAVARRAHNVDRGFRLPPMEGLWWVEGDRSAFEVPREEWHWELLLRVPDDGMEELVQQVAQELGGRAAQRIRFVRHSEGLCVQALHVGPYDTEPQTLETMDAFMRRENLERNGRHHEIYLTPISDSTPPSEGQTILRQPVRRSIE